MITPKFHGSNTNFWVGVVEDINDEKAKDKLKLGRVRVRVLGYHSETKTENNELGEGIPTDKLHWAYPIAPITSASVSGIGQSPLGVVKGSWVVGLSMDGNAMQDLYILGSLAGVPQKRLNPDDQGFCDPDDIYPLDEFLKESDVNRLARNDTNLIHPMLTYKEEARVKGIPTSGGETWDEPESPYEAEYPHNHVIETTSGHITETDDTPGSQRTHKWHPSGTYTEIDASGSRVTKITGADFEIVLDNKSLYVAGNLSITVGGNANILVKENCTVEAAGDLDISSRKNIMLTAEDTFTVMAKDIQITSKKGSTITAGGPIAVVGANTDPTDVASGVI
jgi:hypothetical protein